MKHTKTEEAAEDVRQIAEDAKILLGATAHVAEEKVVEARKRLSDALEKGKSALAAIRDRTVEGAKAADESIRAHPYQAVGIAFGVGAVIGFLLHARRANHD